MTRIWNRLFLEERPSIGLSLFRIAVALTVGFHVLPSFVHLDDTYLSTAFKIYNTSFFTPGFVELVQKSTEGVVIAFVWLFIASWFCFLIGLFSSLVEKKILGPTAKLLLMAGFCGAFTTFSAFMLENSNFIRQGETFKAFLNIALSLTVGFALFRLGVLWGEKWTISSLL